MPGRLASPVWVDDTNFDISYHLRRSALPQPGTMEQLEDFVGRVQPRILDRERPLWEVYVVEGLEDGRFAIVTKSHHSMIDEVGALDVAQVILSDRPITEVTQATTHTPRRSPTDVELIVDAVVDALRRPGAAVENARLSVGDLARAGRQVASGAGRVLSTVVRSAARPAPPSPLNVTVGAARRIAMVQTDLEAHRAVRRSLGRGAYADEVTVNDVVLATISGALRGWMLMRGLPVHGGTVVRAMVPVSVYDSDSTGAFTSSVMPCFVNLPVGEPSAFMRLHQIAFAMRQQLEGGRTVQANAIASLGGFAPATLHSLGARLGSAMTRRQYNLMVTNVPGPQTALYAGAAPMVATYPVMPLGKEQTLSIGVTSYAGKVYYCLNADRDSMPDLQVIADGLTESLIELADGATGAH